jgi:hypothetical protein
VVVEGLPVEVVEGLAGSRSGCGHARSAGPHGCQVGGVGQAVTASGAVPVGSAGAGVAALVGACARDGLGMEQPAQLEGPGLGRVVGRGAGGPGREPAATPAAVADGRGAHR